MNNDINGLVVYFPFSWLVNQIEKFEHLMWQNG